MSEGCKSLTAGRDECADCGDDATKMPERASRQQGHAYHYHVIDTTVGNPNGYRDELVRQGLHNAITESSLTEASLDDWEQLQPYRHRGVGRLLMERLCEVALAKGCSRLEWTADADNPTAQRFYGGFDLRPHDGKVFYRIERAGIRRLADALEHS